MGSFPDDVVRRAWARSGGRCECKRSSHTWHVGRCIQRLLWRDAGKDVMTGWEARHAIPQEKGGSDTIENCEIVCIACYKAATSPG